MSTLIGARSPDPNADEELITRCDQFAHIENQLRALADGPDDGAFEQLSDETHGTAEALLDQFCDIPAQTFDGIVAKARAAIAYAPDMLNEQPSWQDHIVASILRDLLGKAE